MSHFAKIENSLVTNVIVAEQSFIDTMPGTWVQTSYNTHGGVHYGANGLPDSLPPLRANFAGVGHHYDAVADVFYEPKPSVLHALDTVSYTWKLKPEFSPLAQARVLSPAAAAPSGAPGPIVIEGVTVNDNSLVFFPNATTNPGIYKYYAELGLLSYQNHATATVQVAGDDTQVWKFNGTAWVSQPV
jgi:hypothetical protein